MSAERGETIFCNPGWDLREKAKLNPNKAAIVSPLGQLSFREFDRKSDEIAYILTQAGIKQGDKIILMIKPSIDLYSIAVGLLKCGAIPVVVDPGMGIKRMLHSYRSISATAFIGIPPTHIIRRLAPKFFESVKIKIWVRDGKLSTETQKDFKIPTEEFPIAQTRAEDLAIINFTTGSTGPAKPVEASYGMLMATVAIIQKSFGQTTDDIDMVTVPFFGIVSIILGSTVVIPPMNPAKPGDVDPQQIIDTIQKYKITTMLASPALFAKVGPYAAAHKITLPSLRNVNSGGAPISLVNLATFNSLLSEKGQTYSSWGATEGLPLATISGREILDRYKGDIETGKGSPIGRILHPIEARLIKITDERISEWNEALRVPEGAIGEVIVHGPNVSKSYHMSPSSNADHKITEGTSEGQKIWHRTGDLAWMDPNGVLFFSGRKAHAFFDKKGQLMHSVACEGVANAHPKVKQSALVGVDGLPVICLQLLQETDASGQDKIRAEVLELLAAQEMTKDIRTILFHKKFPVDLRHNAKIERPRLAIWARHVLSPQSKMGLYAKIIPIAGWIYIAVGLIFDLPAGFWTWIWWIDLVLSVVVHIAQIPEGIKVGSLHGYSAKQSAWRTFVFGATWWKPLRPQPRINEERR